MNDRSIAAHHGGGGGALAYAAAKGAIHTFTRGLAKVLAPRGITVNAVAPAFILDTHFHATFTTPEVQDASITQTLHKRGDTPADAAGVVLYLVSELAAYVTGEVAAVNGVSSSRQRPSPTARRLTPEPAAVTVHRGREGEAVVQVVARLSRG